MRAAIGETERRREKQIAHNLANGIVPRTVTKRIKDIIGTASITNPRDETAAARKQVRGRLRCDDEKSLAKAIKKLEKEMQGIGSQS